MPKPVEKLKAILTLGRISNLPTVWTNIFAGMILGMYGQGVPLFQVPADLVYKYEYKLITIFMDGNWGEFGICFRYDTQ